jgi:hypothetical protein
MQAETALKAFGEWAVQTWKVGAAFIKNPGA